MTVRRGRIVRQGQPMTELTLANAQTEPASEEARMLVARGHIVRRERVQAAQDAERIVADAKQRAHALIEDARREAAQVRDSARQQGVAEGAAKLAAAWMVVKRNESRADELALDRSISIARLLAERLLGESLRLDPDVVAGIAREAMSHLWRSRKVTIHANPDDVAALERNIATFGMPPERIQVVSDPTRDRGSLRFASDFGELDGELGPQLDRLEGAIRHELETS